MIRLWPVIHVRDVATTVQNARVAQACGACGVFLIHMAGDDALLDPMAQKVREACSGLFVGLNYLSLDAETALGRALAQGHDATWTDRPGVHSNGVEPGALAMSQQLQTHPDHTLFASVAFKYQPFEPDPGDAAATAWSLGFVPTTSGIATGVAPDVSKLQTIRARIGNKARLAVASGMTPDNAESFAPFVTDVLVSTGVSSDFHTFDAQKLARLAKVLI